MPEHELTSDVEIITDGVHHRRYRSDEKLRIPKETLDDHGSTPIVARRSGRSQAQCPIGGDNNDHRLPPLLELPSGSCRAIPRRAIDPGTFMTRGTNG